MCSFVGEKLGVKRSTQNDFIYGELGPTLHQITRQFHINKKLVQRIHLDENKRIKNFSEILRSDIETNHNYKNWCLLVNVYCFQPISNYVLNKSTFRSGMVEYKIPVEPNFIIILQSSEFNPISKYRISFLSLSKGIVPYYTCIDRWMQQSTCCTKQCKH